LNKKTNKKKMLGKITGALIRKEADTYRSQGLNEEALALFRKSLNITPELPPDIKNAIEEQIQKLEAEMDAAAVHDHEQLSDEQIAIIKEGWGGETSVEEIAVSAHALHAMGCYRHALEEFSTLMQQGYYPRRVIGAMADCLARLNPIPELGEAIDRLAAKLLKEPKNNFAFKLCLLDELIKGQFVEHALELSRQLKQASEMPRPYRTHLEGLMKQLKPLARRKSSPSKHIDSSTETTCASASAVQRICAMAKALFARVRPPKDCQ
jgi:tetratricopeptide (TPR) repeat protein